MQPLKVLILEDNPFQLMVLHQMLNAFRIFDVLAAQNVASARNSLAGAGPLISLFVIFIWTGSPG